MAPDGFPALSANITGGSRFKIKCLNLKTSILRSCYSKWRCSQRSLWRCGKRLLAGECLSQAEVDHCLGAMAICIDGLPVFFVCSGCMNTSQAGSSWCIFDTDVFMGESSFYVLKASKGSWREVAYRGDKSVCVAEKWQRFKEDWLARMFFGIQYANTYTQK